MEIRFPIYLMIQLEVHRLEPTVERVLSSKGNRYVLNIALLAVWCAALTTVFARIWVSDVLPISPKPFIWCGRRGE